MTRRSSDSSCCDAQTICLAKEEGHPDEVVALYCSCLRKFWISDGSVLDVVLGGSFDEIFPEIESSFVINAMNERKSGMEVGMKRESREYSSISVVCFVVLFVGFVVFVLYGD